MCVTAGGVTWTRNLAAGPGGHPWVLNARNAIAAASNSDSAITTTEGSSPSGSLYDTTQFCTPIVSTFAFSLRHVHDDDRVGRVSLRERDLGQCQGSFSDHRNLLTLLIPLSILLGY